MSEKRTTTEQPGATCQDENDLDSNDIEEDSNSSKNINDCDSISKMLKTNQNNKRYYDLIRTQKLAAIRKEELGKKHPCKESLLHSKLKSYHDNLIQYSTDTVTWRLCPEVREVKEDVNKVGDESRKIICAQDDLTTISTLTEKAKKMQIPKQWTWAADDNSQQGKYNYRRMKHWLTEALKTNIVECINCDCTSLLIGEEIRSRIC